MRSQTFFPPIFLLYFTTFSLADLIEISPPLSVQDVYRFENTVSLENIAVRANGDLLVTQLNDGNLWKVSCPSGNTPEATLVHSFDDLDGLLGIASTKPDTFVVVGGKFSSPGIQVNGSFSAWSVDFSCKTSAQVKHIADLPAANFPNGMETLPHKPHVVLIADSSLGLVWRLDTRTGSYEVAVKTSGMNAPPGSPVELGINGIRIHNGHLYWTNSLTATIYRVRVGKDGFAINGATVETVVQESSVSVFDDFTFDDRGNMFVTTNVDNRVLMIREGQESLVIAGGVNDIIIAGATSCKFGRGLNDRSILYVVTTGGTEGRGKITAIDIRGLKPRASRQLN